MVGSPIETRYGYHIIRCYHVTPRSVARGLDVSYETIRRWVIKFGPVIARHLRLNQARPGDVWHLNEVIVTISGRKYWLWRAIDQHGVMLDEILQPKRDKRAAKRLLRGVSGFLTAALARNPTSMSVFGIESPASLRITLEISKST